MLSESTRSIQLPFPTTDGNNGFGLWKMRNDRTAVGLTGGFDVRRDTDTNDAGVESTHDFVSLAFGPAVKGYRQVHSTLAAFGTVGIQGIYSRVDQGSPQNHELTTWGGRATVGVGAEWFPFSRVSLGGTTGLTASWTSNERDGNVESSGSSFGLSTYTSSILVQFYF